jgi:hypothetical protein
MKTPSTAQRTTAIVRPLAENQPLTRCTSATVGSGVNVRPRSGISASRNMMRLKATTRTMFCAGGLARGRDVLESAEVGSVREVDRQRRDDSDPDHAGRAKRNPVDSRAAGRLAQLYVAGRDSPPTSRSPRWLFGTSYERLRPEQPTPSSRSPRRATAAMSCRLRTGVRKSQSNTDRGRRRRAAQGVQLLALRVARSGRGGRTTTSKSQLTAAKPIRRVLKPMERWAPALSGGRGRSRQRLPPHPGHGCTLVGSGVERVEIV